MQKYYELREKRRRGEGGFTLIELLVVMVIIGILAAIAIPLFLSQKTKAHETAMKNDLRNAATYFETWAVDHAGSYAALNDPTDLTGMGFHASENVVITIADDETTATGFQVHATYTDDANAGAYTFKNDGDPQLSKDAPVAP